MIATTHQIHWVQFPATALTDQRGVAVDWNDHKLAHRAVSRLFTPVLPGTPGRQRAEAGILFRLDTLALTPTVLVQSRVPPELVPTGARSLTVPERAWMYDVGEQIAFRVALNPVKRTTRRYADADKKVEITGSARESVSGPRKQTAKVVPANEIVAWATEKLHGALLDVEIVNYSRRKTQSGSHTLAVDTVDGLARVGDSQVFNRLRVEGVGRAKAYGCGLLTATRLNRGSA